MNFKKLIKSIYNYMIRQRHLFVYKKISKKIIREANPKILELDKPQKKAIQSYYQKFGYKKIYTGYHRIITSINEQFSERYIPEDLFHADILPKLNNFEHSKSWGDKSIFGRLFVNVRFPDTLIYNINGVFYDELYKKISREKAVTVLEDLNDFVIKPSLETGSGKGVMYYTRPFNVENVFDIYKKNYVIQKRIVQHEFYNMLNKSSINSLKIISLFWEDEIHILSSLIRVGSTGSFTDNVSSGNAYMINVNHQGYLHGNKFNFYGNILGKSHLHNEYYCKTIPGYVEAINLIKKMHINIPYFKLISWDIAIDGNCEPIIIEYNLKAPDAKMHQIYNGPLFGDLTEQILEFVANS